MQSPLTPPEAAELRRQLANDRGTRRALRAWRRGDPGNRSRCADCGLPGERTGHMGCQFPGYSGAPS